VERLPAIWRSGEGERVGRRGVVGGRSGRRRGRRRPGWWRAAAEFRVSGYLGSRGAPWSPAIEEEGPRAAEDGRRRRFGRRRARRRGSAAGRAG